MLFLVICIFTSIVNLLLGLFVYLRNTKGKSNRLFALLVASIVGWIVTLLLYYLITDPLPLLFIGRLNFAVSVPMTFFFYCLVTAFPKESVKTPRFIYITALIVTIVVAFLSLLTPFIDQNEVAVGDERIVTYGSLYFTWPIVFFANLLLGFIVLVIKIKKSTGFTRLQLSYLLLGFLLFIGIGGTMNVILPYFGNYTLQQFGPLTTILFVGVTTYAIVRHRLLNIRLLVARSVVYSILVLLIGLAYSFVILFVKRTFFGITLGLTQEIVYLILVLFIAITFQPLKEYIKQITDKFLYKGEYKPNILLSSLNNTLIQTIELEVLIEKTLVEIVKGVHLSKGAVVIFKGDAVYKKITVGLTNESFNNEANFLALAKHRRILVHQEEEDAQIHDLLEKMNVSVVIPLITGEKLHGVLLLGEKLSGQIFTEEDIQFLGIFGPGFAVAVENSKAYEEIKDFNRTLQEQVDKATSELRLANEHLKELDKLKDEFVAIASHELRTPMNVIRGNLWLILNEHKNLSPDDETKIKVSLDSAQHLIALVSDILDVSAIEGKRVKLNPSNIDLKELIQAHIEEMQSLAQQKNINLESKIENDKVMAYADPDKVKQVLTNLIGNAFKFTPGGGSITISAIIEGKNAKVSVADTGPGIKKDDLSKLFTKFGKLETSFSKSTNTSGVGLGLYISKNLIEMSHGEITIESEVGKGTTFSFTLPIS